MKKDIIKREYSDWIKLLVCDNQPRKQIIYSKLLKYLHNVKFEYLLPMDGNRAEDGIALRYRFGFENYYQDSIVGNLIDNSDCSMLEMMTALSLRCEEQIMCNPDIGNRTGVWFWNMIDNLGLSDMTNVNFDKKYVDNIIKRFLTRTYKRNGEGGLFVLKHCIRDLRSVEIWYQAMWYLDEYLEEQKEYDT